MEFHGDIKYQNYRNDDHSNCISYYDCDFNYEEFAAYMNDQLPLILPSVFPDHAIEETSADWNAFYSSHRTGEVYKPRRFLYNEFKKYFNELIESSRYDTIMEVGCGHGSSIYPLMDVLPSSMRYIATDYSENAIHIFKSHKQYNESVIASYVWDICSEYNGCIDVKQQQPYVIVCVFCLSAVDPVHHVQCLSNMAMLLPTNGCLLFRDYGYLDLTMLRHKNRIGDRLYRRDNDNTLAYYFTTDYIREIVSSAALVNVLTIEEISYATIINRNRKTGIEMKRVFLHGMLSTFKSIRSIY